MLRSTILRVIFMRNSFNQHSCIDVVSLTLLRSFRRFSAKESANGALKKASKKGVNYLVKEKGSRKKDLTIISKPGKNRKQFPNNDVGVTEIKQNSKNDQESHFMKLWTFTEETFKDKVKYAVKGNARMRPKREIDDVKTVDIARLIGHRVTPKHMEIPDEDDTVTYRVPSVSTFGENRAREIPFKDINQNRFASEQNVTFSDLGVHPKLCEKLERYDITKPSVIQKKALPLVFGGKNVLIQSETGSGKSLIFLLPSVQDPGRAYGTIIVVPTRELSSQMMYEAHRLLRDKTVATSFVSGVELSEQEKRLKDTDHPPRVIIGTPKRLLQIVKSYPSLFQRTKRIVIDEVDKALQPLHQKASVKKILSRASHPRAAKELVEEIRKASKVLQIQLIGATATAGAVLKEDLRDLGWGDHVSVVQPPSYTGKHRSVPTSIAHNYVVCDDMKGITKAQMLARIFRETRQQSALAFVHRKHSVDDFVWELKELGINAVALYQQVADQNTGEFEKFLEHFRTGRIQVVVGNEETVRGLDFKELDHVYLMEVPKNVDEFIHLAGRVGRQGRPGTATTFVSKAVQGEERRLLLEYRRLGLSFKNLLFKQ